MSTQYPFLSKAPIIEAVLDIRTIPAQAWDEAGVSEKIKSEFGNGFTFENENTFSITVAFTQSIPQGGDIPETGWSGLKLTSLDKTEIIQIKRDVYVYSRLQPYTGWETFKEKSLSGWNKYRKINPGHVIKRIGLRFINRIEFTANELPELLRVYPVQVGLIEKDIAGYLQQNIYSYENGNYNSNFIQTVQPPVDNNGKPSIIIDIDVYTTDGLRLCEKDLELCMEKIRAFKNDLFFGAVTEKLVERLK